MSVNNWPLRKKGIIEEKFTARLKVGSKFTLTNPFGGKV